MVVRDGLGRERADRDRSPIGTSGATISWRISRNVAGKLPGGERRVPLDVQVISTTKEPGFIRKKISFATEPGDRVPAWLLVPDPARKPAAKRAGGPVSASDDRDRQGRAGRARPEPRAGLRTRARRARLRHAGSGLPQLRRIQDQRLRPGLHKRDHEGHLEQPARRRSALQSAMRSIRLESASSATRSAGTTRSSRRSSTAGSRPSSRRAASTPSRSTTRATSRAGRTRATCRGCELATGSTSRKSPSTSPS